MNDDPRLEPFGEFTSEGRLNPGYGDHYLFFVGRDDCHGLLKMLLGNERTMLKFNMFGYDDDELNEVIMGLLHKPTVRVQATLDKSQSGGVHERAIIAADMKLDPVDFSNSFVIGQSATHQISHTKGGICVGQGIAWEGSMNWSASGEGIGINLDGKQRPGFKAQNNTLLVSTNPVFIARFSARLDAEHHDALAKGRR